MILLHIITILLTVPAIVIGFKEMNESDDFMDFIGIGAGVTICFISLGLCIFCMFN